MIPPILEFMLPLLAFAAVFLRIYWRLVDPLARRMLGWLMNATIVRDEFDQWRPEPRQHVDWRRSTVGTERGLGSWSPAQQRLRDVCCGALGRVSLAGALVTSALLSAALIVVLRDSLS